jgi:lipoprotein NlpI
MNTLAKPPNLPSLDKQLDYVWHEFHTTEKSAYNKLLTATTLPDAVAAMIHYERDASYKQISKGVWGVDRNDGIFKKKLAAAQSVLSSASYTGGPTS